MALQGANERFIHETDLVGLFIEWVMLAKSPCCHTLLATTFRTLSERHSLKPYGRVEYGRNGGKNIPIVLPRMCDKEHKPSMQAANLLWMRD